MDDEAYLDGSARWVKSEEPTQNRRRQSPQIPLISRPFHALTEVGVRSRLTQGSEIGADEYLAETDSRGNNVNKNDLIDAIAADADLSKASAGRALDAAIGAITGELAKGGGVSLVGFGTFSVKARAARQGRNPRTGETIQIAASKHAWVQSR